MLRRGERMQQASLPGATCDSGRNTASQPKDAESRLSFATLGNRTWAGLYCPISSNTKVGTGKCCIKISQGGDDNQA